MNNRGSVLGTIFGKTLSAAAVAALFAAMVPHAFAQTDGAAVPPSPKPPAASDDVFGVTPPPAKAAPAAKPDSDSKAPAAKSPDPFPFDFTPKPATDKGTTDKGTDKGTTDKGTTDKATTGAAPKTPAAKPRKGDDFNPFHDDTEPGKLVPIPKDPEAKTPAPDAPVPLTPNPAKPLTNEPTDLKSTEVETTPGQAEFKQGQDLAAAGKYAEAIEAYKKSLKLAKNESSTYSALGVAYRMLNRYDDAIIAYTEAIRFQSEVDKDAAEPYLRRGICWFQKHEYGLAGLDFDDAAGIDFTDPRAPTWKGMTLARQGQLLDAINTYSTAIRYDNRYVLAHVNRGLAYAALRDYKKAVVDFDSAINVTPKDPTLYFKRAVAESSGGDWQAAVNSYNEAIRLDPQYAAAYKNRGEAYRQLGDAARAQADSKRAQELSSPSDKKTAQTTAPSRK